MTRYAKAIIAFFTSLGTWGSTGFADGSLTGPEWFGLSGVIVATFTVFAYPNTPPAGEASRADMSEQG